MFDEDYVALRFNTIAGESKINVIMRRPDGYVSDVVVDLFKPVIEGVCAICEEDMLQTKFGYMCSQHDTPVVMTTHRDTVARKIVSNHKTMIRDNKVESQKVDFKSIKDQVADALGDLL